MLNACYPMKGILDPLPTIRSASQIKIEDRPTVFLNARVYYNRDVELIEVWRRVLDVIERCIEAPVSGLLGTLGRLREHCADWAGQDNAEELMETFAELSEALRFQFSALGPLSTIYFGVSLRHITRPLVPIPARLRQDEEDYWLPHVFNIWPDQAREDYLDFHGGELAPVSIGSLVPFLRRLNGIADRLERIAGASRDAFLGKMAIALRIHAAVLRTVGNFHQMQTLRNRNKDKLAQTSRPSKVGDWAGDADLQKSNELMRDELDNTHQFIDLLKEGGMDLIAHAKDPADEDTFLLGPDLVGQLTKKCEVMRRHWLDIEDHLSTPLK